MSVRPSGAVVQLPRFPVPGMVPHPIYGPAMVPPPPPPPPSKLAELQLELDTHPVIIYITTLILGSKRDAMHYFYTCVLINCTE